MPTATAQPTPTIVIHAGEPRMLSIHDGDYAINLNFVTSVDTSNPDSWNVTVLGEDGAYTLEDDDLIRFQEAMGYT